MSNEQKAREICGCGNCYHNFKGNECLKDTGILCCLKPCLKDTLQAMQWKDEQHAKEKQQWIEKACEFLKRNAERYTCLDFNDGCAKAIYDEDELVADFKKAMKGE